MPGNEEGEDILEEISFLVEKAVVDGRDLLLMGNVRHVRASGEVDYGIQEIRFHYHNRKDAVECIKRLSQAGI